MTNDEALLREAHRLWKLKDTPGSDTLPQIVLRLAREGWTPPVVTADLIAAREICAEYEKATSDTPYMAEGWRSGRGDGNDLMASVLAAIKRGRELERAGDPPPADDGWIDWHGGENPAPGKFVDVRLGTRRTPWDNRYSHDLRWDRRGTDGDIVAYRVVI
jgi:hypothetical protein